MMEEANVQAPEEVTETNTAPEEVTAAQTEPEEVRGEEVQTDSQNQSETPAA